MIESPFKNTMELRAAYDERMAWVKTFEALLPMILKTVKEESMPLPTEPALGSLHWRGKFEEKRLHLNVGLVWQDSSQLNFHLNGDGVQYARINMPIADVEKTKQMLRNYFRMFRCEAERLQKLAQKPGAIALIEPGYLRWESTPEGVKNVEYVSSRTGEVTPVKPVYTPITTPLSELVSKPFDMVPGQMRNLRFNATVKGSNAPKLKEISDAIQTKLDASPPSPDVITVKRHRAPTLSKEARDRAYNTQGAFNPTVEIDPKEKS